MTTPLSLKNGFNKLPLRHKILIPFFLIIIIFGCVVSFGTYHLIQGALISTANQRLTAIQEIIFREIKKQEFRLLTYGNMVEFQYYTSQESQSDPFFALRQDKLLRLLGDGNVTAISYPAAGMGNYGALDELFRQATASGKARFRFFSNPDVPALLTVAVPLPQVRIEKDLLLLQTPVDTDFLKQIVAPFQTDAAIIDLDRNILVATAEDLTLNNLSDDLLTRLIGGEKISQTVERNGYHRQLYSAIPIGNSEIVILAVDLPLADLDLLMKTLATRAGLTILFALGIGALIFYRLINSITRPLNALLNATREISSGNLSYQIEGNMTGEFQQLAEAFNHMLSRVETLYLEKADQDKNLALAQEQLHFNNLLEEKNQEIERTNQELRVHLREISMLLQLNQVMNSTLEVSVMFDRTLNLLRDFIGSSNLVLFLYHPETKELTARKAVGAEADIYSAAAFKLNEGITGAAALSKELLYVLDINNDKRYLNYKSRSRDKGSMISAPIVAKDQLLGVLNLHKAEIEGFNDTDIELIRATTNQLAVAIENSQLYEKTRLLSNTDELTNIPNRRYFQAILRRECAHAQRFNSSFSIIMIDIDHFKRYNDTYGHINGDLTLTRVATILLQNTRGVDQVARFGGEEFIVLLSNTNKEGASLVAEKLRNAVAAEDFVLSGKDDEKITEKVSISLGIAEYPNDSTDLEVLIKKADRALYAAKAAGRNRSLCWQEDL
ncbi:MAG: diguanylate cyclase [Desulfuromonadales bacterium]|nr:diguanylate cyclase [Desulfuromonadales bacterium]